MAARTKKIGTYKVPFDRNGNLMHYATNPLVNTTYLQATDWVDNEPFEMALRLDSMRSGRSAKYVIWLVAQERQYPMFISDLLELLTTHRVSKGFASTATSETLRWQVRKRGQNFGIALAPEA